MKYNGDISKYTKVIAVSIPIELYDEMEKLANETQCKSRSKLYTDALISYKSKLLKKIKREIEKNNGDLR